MRLPQIPYNVQKSRSEIVAMRGINYSDQIQDGDLRDSLNVSARRWPYLTTIRSRGTTAYTSIDAMTAWEKLVLVKSDGTLLYDGAAVGTVTPGEKQFAVVNTKLIIWPDKVYLDIASLSIKAMGASASGSGAVLTTSTMKVTGWGDLTQQFKVGDAIAISGCTVKPENNKDIIIKGLTADTITASDNAFAAATETGTITIERKIPDMDYICESENRLWGCSSETQTIYASSLGDPTNFYVYEGLSTDGYALAVGTEGDFTGCCKLSSSVLFWKETKLHKILGSYPAEYSMYTYDIEGLQKGSHKSLQVINETLFYMGLHGVYAYTGGTPSLISTNFGGRTFTNAVGGNDGDSYYLSVNEGNKSHLFVYETLSGIWLREDNSRARDFARIGKDLYMLYETGEKSVVLMDSGEEWQGEWMAQFTPFYETIQGRKTYSRILLRMELPKGSYMSADVRTDGGAWKTCGKVVGKEYDTTAMRIPINRCDKFEIRLQGKGPCTILSILREFSVGSDA